MDRGELSQQESADSGMVALEKSDDVRQFAGKLVAVKSEEEPITGCWGENGNQFGYIYPKKKELILPVYSYDNLDTCATEYEHINRTSLDTAYELCKVVVPTNEIWGQYVLTHVYLEFAKLKVRVANTQEIKKIRDKVEDRELIIALNLGGEVTQEEKLRASLAILDKNIQLKK